MHEQPIYQRQGMFPNRTYQGAEYLARKGFYIPSGLALTQVQMDRVVTAVHSVMIQIMKKAGSKQVSDSWKVLYK